MPLSPNARAFTVHLANLTGLNPSVIGGWVMAETSGHNTTNGPNNWLNVGSFDSGFQGGGANVWQNPNTAAAATAAFILGKPVNGIAPPLGGGAPSIRSITSTVGHGPAAQVQAIQNSGWASSHYNGNLMADVKPFLGQNWQVGGGGQVGTGGITPAPGGVVAKKLGMTAPTINKQAIVSNYLAQEPSINPWNLPIPGTQQTTGTDIAASQNPLLQPGQPLALGQPLVNPGHAYKLAQNGLQNLAGNQPLRLHPGVVPGYTGYVNPIKGASIGRTDMGVDLNLPVGAPIRAIGDSRVMGIYPNWFQGQPYILLKLLNGPQKGKYYYVAEQIAPKVRAGQVLHAGDTIGRYASSGTGIEMGWGTPTENTLAQATTGYSEGQVTAGQSFRNFLGRLGA